MTNYSVTIKSETPTTAFNEFNKQFDDIDTAVQYFSDVSKSDKLAGQPVKMILKDKTTCAILKQTGFIKK